MTPKEKAIELQHKFCSTTEGYYKSKKNLRNAKQCALIAVEEIIKLDVFECNEDWSNENGDTREYWQEVKKEIKKL